MPPRIGFPSVWILSATEAAFRASWRTFYLCRKLLYATHTSGLYPYQWPSGRLLGYHILLVLSFTIRRNSGQWDELNWLLHWWILVGAHSLSWFLKVLIAELLQPCSDMRFAYRVFSMLLRSTLPPRGQDLLARTICPISADDVRRQIERGNADLALPRGLAAA